MSEISITAKDLMAGADAITGVRPGMSPEEIRKRQDMPIERQKAIYFIREYKLARDSETRGNLHARMVALVAEHPHLRSLFNRELPDRILSRRKNGRPRKHASDLIARREASRAYRARRKDV